MGKREKLEDRAIELGIDPQGTSDNELQDLINEAQNEDDSNDDSSDTKYYRSVVHGLSVAIGEPNPAKGEVAPKTVDFKPYEEMHQGDHVKVGYLATSNGSAIKKLAGDANVTEISRDDFEKATGDDSKPTAN